MCSGVAGLDAETSGAARQLWQLKIVAIGVNKPLAALNPSNLVMLLITASG